MKIKTVPPNKLLTSLRLNSLMLLIGAHPYMKIITIDDPSINIIASNQMKVDTT